VQPSLPIHPGVVDFLQQWKLRDPVYLDYTDVGENYEPNFCHVSAKHIALKLGGRRVHGWALWLYSQGGVDIVMGDFHSVWEDANGTLVDVTPPKAATGTLFVRDPSLMITREGTVQKLYCNRTNVPDAPRLWEGQPTDEESFSVPDDQPSLVAYCKKLGLPDTSML
jgi:hypothetical protein